MAEKKSGKNLRKAGARLTAARSDAGGKFDSNFGKKSKKPSSKKSVRKSVRKISKNDARKIHDEKKVELKLSLRRRHLHAVAIGAAVVLAVVLLVGSCGNSACPWGEENRAELQNLHREIARGSQENQDSAEDVLVVSEELERSGVDLDSEEGQRAQELARDLFGEEEIPVEPGNPSEKIVLNFWDAVARGDRGDARAFFGQNLRRSSVIQTFFGGTRLEKFAAGLDDGLDVVVLERKQFGGDGRLFRVGVRYSYRGESSSEVWEIELVPVEDTRRITKLRCATEGCTTRPFFGILQ